MAQYHLGQKVKLIGKPAHHHLSWPIGTTGTIVRMPRAAIGFEQIKEAFGIERFDWYLVDPDQPQSICRCNAFTAPAACLVPIQYDGHEPQQKDTEFDFTTEDELEAVT